MDMANVRPTAKKTKQCNDPLLFVCNSGLQTDLLIDFVSRQLGMTCQRTDPDGISAEGAFEMVLLDCKSIGGNASRYLERLHARQPFPVVVLYNTTPDSNFERLIRWPGIKGIFYDSCTQAQLVKGLQAILNGDTWLPRKLLNEVLERQRAYLPITQCVDATLTSRERDILALIATGATNTRIARQLCVSEHTVKSHMYNIFKKIRVRNRVEAVNWAKLHLHDMD